MFDEIFHIDIITSILVKLSIASLLRFKSVSKTWNELISSPYFLGLYRQERRDNESRHRRIIFTDSEVVPSAYSEEFQWEFYKKIVRLYTSDTQCRNTTNNLSVDIESDTRVLFSGFDLVCLANNASPTIYVCNPATREVFPLPSYGQTCVDTTFRYTLFGFAYLRWTDEYIVVRAFPKEDDEGSRRVEMFKFDEHTNLECPASSSWRMAKKTYSRYYEDVDATHEGPFVERNMHWLVSRFGIDVCIFSFDIDHEIFYKINIPTGIYHRFASLCRGRARLLVPFELVDLHGKLGFLDRVVVDDNFFTMSLWSLQERQKSMWVKYHTIEFDCLKLKSVDNSFGTLVRCLYLSDNELLFGIDKGTLYSYNIEKKVLIQLQETTLHIGGFFSESMFRIPGRPKGGYNQDPIITLKLDPLPKYVEYNAAE